MRDSRAGAHEPSDGSAVPDDRAERPSRAGSALEQLYRKELAAVTHAAFLMCGSHHRAAEVAQDAFMAAWIAWPKVSGLDRPGAWVRRVAINLAIKARRREDRTPPWDPIAWESIGTEAEDQTVVDRHAIRDLLATLPAHQRLAIVLTAVYDLPAAEVAAIIGCAEATVRVHLHRARATIARQLGP